METARVLGGLAFVAAFFFAACLFMWAYHALKHSRRSFEAASISGADGGKLERLMRNGVRSLNPLANLLLKLNPIRHFVENLKSVLDSRTSNTLSTQTNTLTTLLIASSIALAIGGFALSRSFVFAITAVIIYVILINNWVNKEQQRYHTRIREELPGALQAMNACFSIGYSLPQIFDQIAGDIEGPLKRIFQQCAAVINAGGTIEEALHVLKHASKEPELFFLATALEIQHKTGSSLAQVLEVVQQSLSDQIELKRLLQTQTAQAKLSAQIVTIMPFLLIGVFSLISEGFLEPFFQSAVGIALLVVALTMQVAGVMMVRKMLKVEVV
jgi:tight adherence protein B